MKRKEYRRAKLEFSFARLLEDAQHLTHRKVETKMRNRLVAATRQAQQSQVKLANESALALLCIFTKLRQFREACDAQNDSAFDDMIEAILDELDADELDDLKTVTRQFEEIVLTAHERIKKASKRTKRAIPVTTFADDEFELELSDDELDELL